MTRWGFLALAALAAAPIAACAHEKPPVSAKASPPKLPAPARRAHVSVAAPDWYWEPIATEADPKPIDLPATNDAIVRVEGASRVWDDLGDTGRDRLRREGIVVLGDAPGDPLRWQLGAFYTEWRERRVPYVITVDALASLVQLAIAKALAEIETKEIAPTIEAMLARMDARLTAEQKGASIELAGGYRLARGVIAVARLLADAQYAPAPDIAAVVREEKQRIDAHEGLAPSPLLDLPIDYARFAAPAGARPSWRVMSWLAAAPFSLAARTEAPFASLDVGAVRHHARAAMLVARLADRDVDAGVHGSFSKIARFFAFAWGPPDDLTPLALGDVADAASIDLAKPENITNVVRVDKVRAAARVAKTPLVSDGGGRATTVRFIAGSAPPDAIAIAKLGGRSTDDVATWLAASRGVEEASAMHASIYGSFIDALATWSTSKSAPSKSAERARTESALAAWTLARHVASSFGRTKPPPPQGTRELRVSGSAIPAFIEPEVETIARLLATLRQARRGLSTLGPLAKGSPAEALLADCEDVLKIALGVAERSVRDEPLAADDVSALAAMPARLAAIETESAAEPGPYAAVIFADHGADRARVSGTGPIEPAIMLVRERGSERLVLAVGAHLTHFDGDERIGANEGAAAVLERRIREGHARRASWTDGFRLAR